MLNVRVTVLYNFHQLVDAPKRVDTFTNPSQPILPCTFKEVLAHFSTLYINISRTIANFIISSHLDNKLVETYIIIPK